MVGPPWSKPVANDELPLEDKKIVVTARAVALGLYTWKGG
jgi:hypothetical protein